MWWKRSRSRALSVGVALGLFSLVFPEARARADERAASEQGPNGAPPEIGNGTANEDPRIAEINALLEGQLDGGVEPQGLFSVPLADPARVDAEIARLQALDQARLKFLTLPEAERARLLALHREQTLAKIAAESATERDARLADEERGRALQAAKAAQTEVRRVLDAELAALNATEQELSFFLGTLAAQKQTIQDRETEVLGWKRQAFEVKAKSTVEIDAFYESLTRALRLGRQELSDTLVRLRSRRSGMPGLKPDTLAPLANDPAAQPILARRRALARQLGQARTDEFAWLGVRADKTMAELESLNAERLGLLDHLSPQKRKQVTGFTRQGWKQATTELWQLTLIVRYHAYVSQRWLVRLSAGDGSVVSPLAIMSALVRLGLLLWAFGWLRRHTPEFLRVTEKSLLETERLRAPQPWSRLHLVQVLRHIERPLTTLLFILAFRAVLNESTAQILEVQLLMSILAYTALGSVAVNLAHALLITKTGPRFSHHKELTSSLLLTSLKFVGSTIVIVLLVLKLSSHLVGKGTIYSWVLSTTWLLGLVVALILIRWWREEIFNRLAEMRQKSAFTLWLLENRTGPKSFFSAILGATTVLLVGASKTTRRWLARFSLVRRVLAYLFRRELAKLHQERHLGTLSELASESYEALHPSAAARPWLACPAEELIERIEARVRSGSPGLIGIVGGRGSGKTALLTELGRRFDSPLLSLSQVQANSGAEVLEVSSDAKVVLVDDAQVWLRPAIGGFDAFDALVSLARRGHSEKLWVLTVDAALWPFLRRARDSDPPFNQVLVLSPWEEEQIATLLDVRSQAANLNPSFESLVERMPVSADEQDWAEEIAIKREGYVRMLWDQSRGNPGLALEMWRSSLKQGDAGKVYVSSIQVPDGIELDALPDTALFLLRAVLQFGPVRPRDVARVARLDDARAFEILTLNATQGILVSDGEFFRVSWPWLSPLRAALQRRHLWIDS